MPLAHQFAYLPLLALPIARASWTVTHEELFREPPEYWVKISRTCKALPQREVLLRMHMRVLFSLYLVSFCCILTRFTLLYDGWRGDLIRRFALVWIANVSMSAFNRLRLEIEYENLILATNEALQERLEAGPDS